MDRPTRFLTVIISLLLAIVLPLFVAAGEDDPMVLWVGLAIGLVIFVLGAGFSPAGYDVREHRPASGATRGEVVVRRRLFGSRTFTITGAVGTPSWQLGFGGMRLGGSSGLFGWYGRFWRADVGQYRAYLTDRSRMVSVETDRGLLLLSPAEREPFIAELEQVRGSG